MHLFDCIYLEKHLISLLLACDHWLQLPRSFRICQECFILPQITGSEDQMQSLRCCLFVCFVCLFEKGSLYIESWLSRNSLCRPSFLSTQRSKTFCLLTAGVKVCATTPSRSCSLLVSVFCFNIVLQCAQASYIINQ